MLHTRYGYRITINSQTYLIFLDRVAHMYQVHVRSLHEFVRREYVRTRREYIYIYVYILDIYTDTR